MSLIDSHLLHVAWINRKVKQIKNRKTTKHRTIKNEKETKDEQPKTRGVRKAKETQRKGE